MKAFGCLFFVLLNENTVINLRMMAEANSYERANKKY
jgi:hypothetical protein